MMRSLIKKLLRQEGHEHILTPQHTTARFELQYAHLVVGELWLENGMWHFAYSDEFRRQSEIKALIDFPDSMKTYTSDELWPFFQVRIPSLEQPAVQREIKERALDDKNEVELLRAFGRKSISNPFVLESMG